MFLHVMTNGAKYWRLKYRFSGKEKLLSMGVYPAISLAKETRFCYQPFAGREDSFRYDPETIEATIRDYNLNDLAI